MKKFISNKRVTYVLGILLLFALWQILAMSIGKEELIFPGPIKTIEYVLILLKNSYIYECISSSLVRMLMGFGLAFILALILGGIAGNSKFISDLLSPLMTSLKAIPTACVVFLFIVLSGAKNAPIYIVFLISFPILYEGVKGGINSVDKELVEAAKMDGADSYETLIRVKFPLSLAYIFVAIASSLSLSFKIEIMAEVITGTTNIGLGSAIVNAQKMDPANLVPIFSYGLIAIVISLILDAISNIIKKLLY